jgi:hypothetical protein
MRTKDDSKKLHNYSKQCVRLEHLYGAEQHAVAMSEGFFWFGSTETHDMFKNSQFRVVRGINKDTKEFYEQPIS